MPPAVTEVVPVFVIEISALVLTCVSAALDVLLPPFGSVVPSEATEATLESDAPSDTEAATVTCTVNLWMRPATRPAVFEQVTV